MVLHMAVGFGGLQLPFKQGSGGIGGGGALLLGGWSAPH